MVIWPSEVTPQTLGGYSAVSTLAGEEPEFLLAPPGGLDPGSGSNIAAVNGRKSIVDS